MEYELRRSDRKTLSMRVAADGRVIVSSPRRLSKAVIDKFVADHADWIEKQRRRPPSPMNRELTEKQEQQLRTAAKELLPPLTQRFARSMGVSFGKVTVTSAHTRFGSCSGKNNIAYSFRLMQYPMAAIEYVVVHELCHTVEKNHGPRFYALLEKHMPDWRARRKLLQ